MKGLITISEKQAASALDIRTCIAAVKDAYIACDKGTMHPGGRIAMPLSQEGTTGQWLTAVCTEPSCFGFKFSANFPENLRSGKPAVRSTISLFSGEDGAQLALIGANHLTALKTGAAAAVATDLLARPDAHRLGIIGTGVQAFTQVQAIQEVRALTELRVYDMSPDRMNSFLARIRSIQNRPYTLIACESANECVAASDIVCTATPSLTPVFDAAALQPGTHLNAIGSYTPFMQEIDAETVQKAAFVVTEHVDGLWAAAGDILIPFEQGLIEREKVHGSVSDVLVGKIPGRQTDAEITLYESVGSCVLDVALAIAVYRKTAGN